MEESKIYMGIDWGDSKIGLAIGDSEARIAVPMKNVPDLASVLKTIKEERIEAIILGKPVKMSGQTEGLTKEFNIFLEELKKSTDLSIELIDERLTSKMADSLMGNKKEKAEQDSIAAMIILQTYFDQNN